MEFEDFALARFDELLEMVDIFDLSDEQQKELNMLEAWYDAWLDYAQACDELRRYYESR